jgi:hypothetical protein
MRIDDHRCRLLIRVDKVDTRGGFEPGVHSLHRTIDTKLVVDVPDRPTVLRRSRPKLRVSFPPFSGHLG